MTFVVPTTGALMEVGASAREVGTSRETAEAATGPDMDATKTKRGRTRNVPLMALICPFAFVIGVGRDLGRTSPARSSPYSHQRIDC
jgi:hypothetical protein